MIKLSTIIAIKQYNWDVYDISSSFMINLPPYLSGSKVFFPSVLSLTSVFTMTNNSKVHFSSGRWPRLKWLLMGEKRRVNPITSPHLPSTPPRPHKCLCFLLPSSDRAQWLATTRAVGRPPPACALCSARVTSRARSVAFTYTHTYTNTHTFTHSPERGVFSGGFWETNCGGKKRKINVERWKCCWADWALPRQEQVLIHPLCTLFLYTYIPGKRRIEWCAFLRTGIAPKPD